MVSSRIYGKSEPDISRTGLSPVMHQGPRAISPGLQAGSMLSMPGPPHSGYSMPSPGHISMGGGGLGVAQPVPGLPNMAMGTVNSSMQNPALMGTACMGNSNMPTPAQRHQGSLRPGLEGPGMLTPGGQPHSGPGIPPPSMVPTGMGSLPVSSISGPMPSVGMQQYHPQHPQIPPGK